jgi:hypothetical protein
MSSIEKSGFLSEEIANWIRKHRVENHKWFSLCEEINEFSHATMLSMTIHNEDLIELISVSLFVRGMSNFQGSIIMAERGMVNESKALLRCLLECMFSIVAVEKDRNVLNQFVLEDLHQRKDYLKAYKRNQSAAVPQEGPPREELDKLLHNIEKEIEEKNIRKMQKRELAEKAGLVAIYDSAYKLLSGTIHVNARDLEQYLELNEDGEVKRILWGPDVKEIDLLLFTAAESMLYILKSVSGIFQISYDETWDKIIEKYNKLGKKIVA